MLKRIAMAAFAAAAMSALGQSTTTTTTTTTNGQVTSQTTDTTTNNMDSSWDMKYSTYHIGSADLGSIGLWDMRRIVDHEMRDLPAADRFDLSNFIDRLPSDQAWPVLKGLVQNYKQASMVRDEVAMARYGNDETYAWLAYPPLTWADTPGQNSWASVTTSTTTNSNGTVASTTTTTEGTPETMIAMTDDSSRPMRMIMAHRNMRDVDYDRAVDILTSGLSYNDKGTVEDLFHPRADDPRDYTNSRPLDAIIHLIGCNAKMVDGIGRWSWYNHIESN